MDREKILNKINKDREKVEASFVFCLWKNPLLYDDFKNMNDDIFISRDSKFFYNLGKAIRNKGANVFDAITVSNFISSSPKISELYNNYGGWNEVQELMDLVDADNYRAYYDDLEKRNNLAIVYDKYEKMFDNVEQFNNATSNDLYEALDLLNNSLALGNKESPIETLVITEDDITQFSKGEDVGLNYSKFAPLLNYTTLGIPVGDIFLLAGHSGNGKSSFTFELCISLVKEGNSVCILSNEMKIKTYKNMLLSHILVNDLKYWKLTRKKIKIGKFTDEDREMLEKARKISEEKYSKLYFIQLFDNDSNIIIRHMKKINRLNGVSCFLWDTFKSDDVSDKMWQQLLMSSRKVFNLISKENWSLICTFQLALYTQNQRYLDASCLSTSKQIKEVVSELIMIRKLWNDEYTGEANDCKPYRYKEGKKEDIQLDPDKTYIVAFIDKTRNDENSKNILFEWKSSWNSWHELGYCNIKNEHIR